MNVMINDISKDLDTTVQGLERVSSAAGCGRRLWAGLPSGLTGGPR